MVYVYICKSKSEMNFVLDTIKTKHMVNSLYYPSDEDDYRRYSALTYTPDSTHIGCINTKSALISNHIYTRLDDVTDFFNVLNITTKLPKPYHGSSLIFNFLHQD